MSTKTRLIEVVVESPKEAQNGKLATLPILAPVAEIITALKADYYHLERHSKMAAFLAIRIGLRLVWLKGNSGHGSLEPFIKEHLSGISRRSLGNYIKVADTFISDLQWRDAKTHKFTDAGKIRPILDERLEIFTDPNAKLDIHCRQLVEWVNGRGLTQIYSDLSEAEEIALPPQGSKTKAPKKTEEQRLREEMQSTLSLFKADFSDAKWKHLTNRDREKLEEYLAECAREVREHNKQVNRTALKSK